MRIGDTVDLWRRELARLGRAPEHIHHCAQAVLDLAAHAQVEHVHELRPRLVIEWLCDRQWAAKSQANAISAVRTWGAFLELIEAVQANPARGVRSPRAVSGTGADAMTLEELRRLLWTVRQRERSRDGRRTRHGPLAETVYVVALHTGLRQRELRMQRWRDIDLQRGLLTVTADKARRRDAIPLPVECVQVLTAWREWSRGDRVFPVLPSRNTLKADLAAAGISGAGAYHRLRKTAITLRAQRWEDYRELVRFARHADARTTLKSYDRVRVEELRGVAEAMPSLWRTGRPDQDQPSLFSLEISLPNR